MLTAPVSTGDASPPQARDGDAPTSCHRLHSESEPDPPESDSLNPNRPGGAWRWGGRLLRVVPLMLVLVLAGCDSDEGALTGPAPQDAAPPSEIVPDDELDDPILDTAVPMAAPTFLPSGFQPPSSFGCSNPGTGYSGANFEVTEYGPNEAGSNKVPVEEIRGDILLNNCTEDDYIDWLDDERERITTQCGAVGGALGFTFGVAGGFLGGVPGILMGAGADGAISTYVCSRQNSHLDQRRDQVAAMDCADRGLALRVEMQNIQASGQTLVVDEKGVACQDEPGGPNYGGVPASLPGISIDGEYEFPSLTATPDSFEEWMFVTDSLTLNVTLNASYASLSDSDARLLNAKLPIDEVGVVYPEGTEHEFVNITQPQIDVRVGYDEAYRFDLECPDDVFSGNATVKFFMAGSEKASIPVEINCRLPNIGVDDPDPYVGYGGTYVGPIQWGEATGDQENAPNEWRLSTYDDTEIEIERVELVPLEDGEQPGDFLELPSQGVTIPPEGETTIDLKLACPALEDHGALSALGVESDGSYSGSSEVEVRLYGASDVLYEQFDFTIMCEEDVYVVEGGHLVHSEDSTCPSDSRNSYWNFEIPSQGTVDVTWWGSNWGTGTITFSPEDEGMWIDGAWAQTTPVVNVSSLEIDVANSDETRTYQGGPLDPAYTGNKFEYEGSWTSVSPDGTEGGCFRGNWTAPARNMGALTN